MRAVIVSGANAAYYPLLEGLIGSIRATGGQAVDLAVLDLGLTGHQRKDLKRDGVRIINPKWDCDLNTFAARPDNFFKAMTSRPRLPDYLPEYDVVMWIDSDCWVQDWSAVSLFLEAAERTGFAAVPEIDRSYTPFMANGAILEWVFSCFGRCFGREAAMRFGHYPLINSGVFAGRADAPHWRAWAEALDAALAQLREPYFFSEQTALNFAIRAHGLPFAALPARCNWVCGRSLPATTDGVTLCDPNPPHDGLGIVHLTAGTKNGLRPVVGIDGTMYHRSLRWNGHDPARVGADIRRD
ncbi:glycosyl transferase family 2 [Magnetospirillum fulvum]|uniref:Glycosyl transferase family 2 n=1 Tax=Magnetospirillum fulvum MGU-K5 TaxID=1316936 RepID=S9TIY0_MAGFU|nr:glycosyl transferase family 2 [Magnetospirillum fulvum]EPY02166.1 glycosyl transferase family 2 [Magnetospirillum fulvum MGU-K5]